MFSMNDILVMLPEIYMTGAACLLLLVDAFLRDEQRGATHWMAVLVLIVAIYLVTFGQPSGTAPSDGGVPPIGTRPAVRCAASSARSWSARSRSPSRSSR